MSGALEMVEEELRELPLNPGPNPTGRPRADAHRGCHGSGDALKAPH